MTPECNFFFDCYYLAQERKFWLYSLLFELATGLIYEHYIADATL